MSETLNDQVNNENNETTNLNETFNITDNVSLNLNISPTFNFLNSADAATETHGTASS